VSIFSRTRDIIAANFSDLLDKAEDPSKMIRMIIVEMEETLVEVRASAARTIADQKEMRRHGMKLDRLQADWGEKAQLALSKDARIWPAPRWWKAQGQRHGRPAQSRDLGAGRQPARL
jgi:phage shock protein A